MSNSNIHLIRWTKDNWQEFKAIRLQAVGDRPDVFLSSYETTLAQPDNYWIDTLTSLDGAVFGLYDGATIIGLTGVFRYRESPQDTAILGMSYIDPAYRGRGLSRMFYEARINWARAQDGIIRVIVSHRAGNDASRAANQAFGFVSTGQSTKIYGDGQEAINHEYELRWEK